MEAAMHTREDTPRVTSPHEVVPYQLETGRMGGRSVERYGWGAIQDKRTGTPTR